MKDRRWEKLFAALCISEILQDVKRINPNAYINTLLLQRGRITYGALQLQCGLTDAQLAILKDELLHAQQVARDEDGRVLVWPGAAETPPALQPPATPP